MSNNLCPICLSNMNEGDNIYKIECGHTFHIECIMKWFRSSKGQCPCCLDNPFTQKHTTTNLDKLKEKFTKLKIKENELKDLRNQKSGITKSNEYRNLIKKRQNIDKKLYNKQNTILKMKAKIISDYPTVQTI